MANTKRIPKTIKNLACQLYLADMPVCEVAEELGISERTIGRSIHERGIGKGRQYKSLQHKKRIGEGQVKAMREERKQGFGSGEANPNYKRKVKLYCSTCGKATYRIPSEVCDTNYCSVDCRKEGFSQAIEARQAKMQEALGDTHGENNPNWRGGTSFLPYPPKWTKELREAIRERDCRECQFCGIAESDLAQHLHIHHVDDNKQNCASENLISLCNNCHCTTLPQVWEASHH